MKKRNLKTFLGSFSWICKLLGTLMSQSNETLVNPLISGYRSISIRDIKTTIRIFASPVRLVVLNKTLESGKTTKRNTF